MSLSSNIRAGAAYVEVTAETSKLQRNLSVAQEQLKNFGRSCDSIGKDLLMLSGAMALPFVLAVKGFAGFDDRMRLAKAVTKATASEFESMTKVAEKLGRETSFTAKEVADGMVSLGRMGFSPKEIEEAIQPTLDLARATGTELGEAADIAANSMRIFGIEAGRMSEVADVLTATANGSAQTLTDLFEALKMAGPQAKAAGENIRDTSAALGILANMGIKGSLAGTAL
ncbi:MAG TPA: phage tail tape measure protein, partial [Opitutales bacterium]|nr:phage tail tape measure protein [Opitutales bacterium]